MEGLSLLYAAAASAIGWFGNHGERGYVMRPTDCMLSDTPIGIYVRSNSGNKSELGGE